MPMFNENYVRIDGGIIVWDGINNPDKNQDGSPKYNLKIVVPPNNPDLPLLDQLAQRALRESEFRGVLPQGGRMPINPVQPGDFQNQFNGWYAFSCKTKYLPDIYNESVSPLQPMQFSPLIYTGQRVDVLVNCYSYNEAGNKGIGVGLSAFTIVESANAPRLVLGNGLDTQAAFGGQQQPQHQQPQHQQPQHQQPQHQQPSYGQQPGNAQSPVYFAGQSHPPQNLPQAASALTAMTSHSSPQQMTPEQYLPPRQ